MDILELEAFTCFPKLPPEIRNQIWKLASIQPQILKVKHDDWNFEYHNNPGTILRVQGFSTDVEASSLLGTCKESRGNFLREFPNKIETRALGRIIRFNADNNTILLWAEDDGNDVSNGVALPDLENGDREDTTQALGAIKHLALDWLTWRRVSQFGILSSPVEPTPLTRTLSYFQNLKTLDLFFDIIFKAPWTLVPSTPSGDVKLTTLNEEIEAGIEKPLPADANVDQATRVWISQVQLHIDHHKASLPFATNELHISIKRMRNKKQATTPWKPKASRH